MFPYLGVKSSICPFACVELHRRFLPLASAEAASDEVAFV